MIASAPLPAKRTTSSPLKHSVDTVVVRDANEVDPSAVRVTLFRGDVLGGLRQVVCGWLIGPPLPGSSTASYVPSKPNVVAAEVLQRASLIGGAIGSRVYIIDPDDLYTETVGMADEAADGIGT